MSAERLSTDIDVKNEIASKESYVWPEEAHEIAKRARAANAIKLELLVGRLQRHTGRKKRECAMFLLRHIASNVPVQIWNDEEIDRVRELAVSLNVESIAKKLGRSAESIRSMCKRRGIRLRDIRCDTFSLHSLAKVLRVRTDTILQWISAGWLEATITEQNGRKAYKISPDALEKCLRFHRQDLRLPNVNAFQAFYDYCYVPDHRLPVREAKRERAAFESLQQQKK